MFSSVFMTCGVVSRIRTKRYERAYRVVALRLYSVEHAELEEAPIHVRYNQAYRQTSKMKHMKKGVRRSDTGRSRVSCQFRVSRGVDSEDWSLYARLCASGAGATGPRC